MISFNVLNRWNASVQFTAEIDCAEDAPTSIKLGLAVKWAIKSSADLYGANLRSANLYGADLRSADLRSADLYGANLRSANLYGADLRSADLRSADLYGADLRSADLRSADLSGANLRSANLYGADLYGADLSSANLRSANLYGADLSSANLSSANLYGADLSSANLSGANLRSANLYGADLRFFRNDFWAILLNAQAEVPGLIKALREGRINGSAYSGECACLVGTIANVRGVDVEDLEQDSSRPAEQWFLMIHEGDTPDKDTGGGFAAKQALEWAAEFCALTGIVIQDAAPPPVTAFATAE